MPALCALGSSEHGCVEVSSGNRSLHLYPYLAWRVQLYAHPNPVRGGVPPPAVAWGPVGVPPPPVGWWA